MKALKVIAIIALLVGIGWLAYLIGFEAANKQNAEIKTDEEKEIKEDEKEKEPEYVPSKVLEVPMEDEVEKKEVTVNTPLDPFGKSLQGLSDSDFRSEDPDEFPGGIDDSVKQIGTWVSNAREEYQYKTITGQEVQTELGYYLTRLADSYQPIESIKLVTESGSTYSLSPRSSAIEQEDFSTYID
ncbi:MAG: hypothetical protein MJ246_07875 [Clostridia bacterium]|nr:hypothetical protein [Clostridia bacterium]